MTRYSFMEKASAFPGRILFDHLPKTAGTAVMMWLKDVLGAGCVSPQVNGVHRKLISKYGGTYSIICAHLDFDLGDMLDPRYSYVTCLREPVDRAVSWLYFVLEEFNYRRDFQLLQNVKRLLESDGKDLDAELVPFISNLYVNHFSRLGAGDALSNRLSVEHCVDVLAKYDLVGIQEDLLSFINGIGRLVGIQPVEKVSECNVTSHRPNLANVPSGLRSRLIELNQLDSQLYAHVKTWRRVVSPPPPSAFPPWQKYERPRHERVFTTPDLMLGKVEMPEGHTVEYGKKITFTVDFFLPRELRELQIGMKIFDEEQICAFATNSVLLGQLRSKIDSGSYCASFHLTAELPAGAYTAGFYFTECLANDAKELAMNDAACKFFVQYPATWATAFREFGDYAYLPTKLSLARTKAAISDRIVAAPKGSIRAVSVTPEVRCGQRFSVDVEIVNLGRQDWVGDIFRPVNIAYWWWKDDDTVLEGERSALPCGGIPKGQRIIAPMLVIAPALPGHYVLILTVVQETVGWFDRMGDGFRPEHLKISVEPDNKEAPPASATRTGTLAIDAQQVSMTPPASSRVMSERGTD